MQKNTFLIFTIEIKKSVNLQKNSNTLMNKLLIIIASITLLSSCSKKKPAVYENDADFHDWINEKTVKETQAHSGVHASVIDSVNIFSLGFSKTIEDIGSGKWKEVHLSYWMYAKSDKAKINTVFSIDFNKENINWEGRPVNIKELNTWVQVNETYKLPEAAKFNNQFTSYVLNESKEEVIIDDLKYEFK